MESEADLNSAQLIYEKTQKKKGKHLSNVVEASSGTDDEHTSSRKHGVTI